MAELRRFYQPVDCNDALMIQGKHVTKGVASGYAIARGTVAATATAAITTGLATITGFAVSGVGGTATKANAARAITASASSGTLTAKRWKATGPSTCTLVAATTAGTIAWVAVGTL